MQLVFSLLAGLVITVALQLTLTSLGAALGLSVISFAPQSSPEASDSAIHGSRSGISLPLTHLAGAGIALGQTTVLFCATLAVTEFGQIADPRRGLIFGIILWSTYWILLLWLSSTTAIGIADSVIGAAAGGSRQLIAALQNTLGKKSAPSEQEILQVLQSEVHEISKRQEQIPQMLAQQRQLLLDKITEHQELLAKTHSVSNPQQESSSQLSKVSSDYQESDSQTWANLKSSASLTFSKVADRSMRAVKSAVSSTVAELDFPSWKDLLSESLNPLDWSDWDLETLWYQIQSLNSDHAPKLIHNAIIRDAEDFIASAPVWLLKQPLLESEFFNRLYDPQAEPQESQKQIIQIDRQRFLDWLNLRDDLSPKAVAGLADSLTEIRDRALLALPLPAQRDDAEPQIIADVQERIVNYCRYTNRDALTSDGIRTKVIDLLETESSLPPVDQALDLAEIQSTLKRRKGVSKRQWQPVMHSLKSTWSDYRDRQGSTQETAARLPRPWAMRAIQSPQNLWHQLNKQIVSYLSYQDKDAFTPPRIAKDLGQIMRTVLRSLPNLSDLSELSTVFDSDTRRTWRQILEQRSDMTVEEIEHILSWCESVWIDALQNAAQALQSVFSAIDHVTPVPQIAEGSRDIVKAIGHQLSEPIEKLQNDFEHKTEALTSEILAQADSAKNTLKVAAWWLSASLIFSGASAAIAGWLAAVY